ncbi:hypothetical protein PV04_02789 [Phialophora macrospora]|uniref:Uncharacterized protein n=1 Tax=Phialophora macrospora TaxID=1851006 RepID=A0A0D2E8C4_9EURO|nr:hypothetical protein PV04_02789 [Phialophora macrospora]
MAYQIYTGVWTDWDRGKILGATLTLSSRDGNLLLAAIALIVTLTSGRLWRILCFAAHQIRSKQRPADGLHYQRQNILRNVSSPGDAVWMFFLQCWYWRASSGKPILRSSLWAAFALLYLAAWAILALFSSRVSSEASSYRLISGDTCGVWTPSTTATSDISSTLESRQKAAADLSNAASYARTCYIDNATSPECGRLPTTSLPWQEDVYAACPFRDPDICVEGLAFKVTTGAIDSHTHLGINAPPDQRIRYERNTVCAPIPTYGYAAIANTTNPNATEIIYNEENLVQYYYGPIQGFWDYTFNYQALLSKSDVGYTITSQEAWPNRAQHGIWKPIDSLQRQDADVSIHFIASNSVRFLQSCDDPVFSAHYPMQTTNASMPTGYEADKVVSVLACTEQHQICNAMTGICSPQLGKYQLFDALVAGTLDQVLLSTAQTTTALRIARAVAFTNIKDVVYLRQYTALRAQERLDGLMQLPLPNNQWHIEISGWVQDGLSLLQHLVQEYVTGPALTAGGQILRGNTDSSSDQCLSQRTRDTQGSQSFSILGLAVTFTIAGLIIISSFFIEALGTLVCRKGKNARYRQLAWKMDNHLQMQRFLFEHLGLGVWDKISRDQSIPRTAVDGDFVLDLEAIANADHASYGSSHAIDQESEVGKAEVKSVVEPRDVESRGGTISSTPVSGDSNGQSLPTGDHNVSGQSLPTGDHNVSGQSLPTGDHNVEPGETRDQK